MQPFRLEAGCLSCIPLWFAGFCYHHNSESTPFRCHARLSSATSHNPMTTIGLPRLRLRSGIRCVLTVASGGFSVENRPSFPRSWSSGFYPQLCYQASLALSLQYSSRICHPLYPPRFGFAFAVRFYRIVGNIQSQHRRASLGKTHQPPCIPSDFTEVRFTGYQDSPSHDGSASSPLPYSRFAVRYVHRFCLMLPSDAPFLETALALLALPFRPVTAGSLPHSMCGPCSQCVMPDTRKNPTPEGPALG